MNNFEEFNKTRYAQMQSSIFNKTGSSIVSGYNISSASKLNLTGRFSIMEDTMLQIEAESHALTKSARVNIIKFRSLSVCLIKWNELLLRNNCLNIEANVSKKLKSTKGSLHMELLKVKKELNKCGTSASS